MKLKIALGQTEIVFGNPNLNLERIASWTNLAAKQGCNLILFPELWSTGYDLENWRNHADEINSGLFQRCSTLARENKIYLGGSLLERSGEDCHNTFALYDPEGNPVATYRKIHLFRPMGEDRWLCAGDRIVIPTLPWGLTGLAICYDLRFPELFRSFATLGARVVLIPAEWPSIRAEHWRTLLRARAIENQMFVVAVNCTGSNPKDKFQGHSMVIDPWGNILYEGQDGEELIFSEIDLDEVDRIRQVIPVLKDRRPDIYGKL